MKRIPAILALFFATISVTLAQEPIIEYGEESELKGITKVYVHTGMDLELHKNISKDLKKKLPDLNICDKPEDAEVFLVFNTDSQTFLAGVSSTISSQETGSVNGQASTYGNSTSINGTYSGQTTSTTTSSPHYSRIETGVGYVFKRVGQNRFRVMMSFKDSRRWRFERKPRTNFAREFIDAYTKANGLKKD